MGDAIILAEVNIGRGDQSERASGDQLLGMEPGCSGRGNMEVEADVAVSLDLGISLGGEATNDETGGLGSNHGQTVTETI